jgi:membrane protein DedA with SNARE-associated domain
MQDPVFQFVSQYGYVGLFGSLVLGIVGLPLPDEWLLTFAGSLISQGRMQFVATVLVGVLGSISGMSLSYYVGHRFGLPLLEKYGGKIGITPSKLGKAEGWFARFGKFAVTFGYFVPGVRHLTALTAGIGKWSYRTFLAYAVPGGLIWVLTFIGAGVYLQEHWWMVAKTLHHYWRVGLLTGLIGLGLWWVGKRYLAKSKTAE